MPRHGGYGRMNSAALDSMQGMYGEDDELAAQMGPAMGSGIGEGSYDTMGAVSPDSLGGDMNIGMSGQDNPADGAGMAGMYTPDYPMGGGGGGYDGAMNQRRRPRGGNPYLSDQ